MIPFIPSFLTCARNFLASSKVLNVLTLIGPFFEDAYLTSNSPFASSRSGVIPSTKSTLRTPTCSLTPSVGMSVLMVTGYSLSPNLNFFFPAFLAADAAAINSAAPSLLSPSGTSVSWLWDLTSCKACVQLLEYFIFLLFVPIFYGGEVVERKLQPIY